MKLTNETFQRKFKEIYGEEFTLLDKYIDNKTSMRIRHNCEYCGNHIRVMRADAILKKLHCRVCEGFEENQKTFEQKVQCKVSVLGKYYNKNTKILVKCKKCGYEWKVLPISLLRGSGCPSCANNLPYTIKDIQKIIKDKYNDEFTVLSEKILPKRHIVIKHNKCKTIYETTIATIIKKATCPHCVANKMRNRFIKTHNEFVKELDEKYHGQFTVLSKYSGTREKILIRHNCDKCNNYIFEILSESILKRGGCPVCSGRKLVKGINDIATTHPRLVKYFANKEDAYKYSHGSNKKIKVKCPDCGATKEMVVADLCQRGFSCAKCSDGISYSEQFIMNLLDQLGIEHQTQYSPNWIKPKRYDFYIADLNMIIETHGLQHYSNVNNFSTCGGRSLEDEQANDKYKREIALANGVKHYIELDCRESNMEWIKNSILNSELSKLLNLSNVNWKSCAKFAISNLAKKVCALYNKIRDIKKVSDLMQINRNTILKYVRMGTELNWCNYDIKNSNKIKSQKCIKATRKPVIVLETLQVFSGCNVLMNKSIDMFQKYFSAASISLVCRGKQKSHKGYHFKYISDLTNEEKILYNIEEKLKNLKE